MQPVGAGSTGRTSIQVPLVAYHELIRLAPTTRQVRHCFKAVKPAPPKRISDGKSGVLTCHTGIPLHSNYGPYTQLLPGCGRHVIAHNWSHQNVTVLQPLKGWQTEATAHKRQRRL